MRKIAVLDQNTIDKIAAGEVVERPSSVVKELVENAIDAGATAVTVEITDGGKKLIRITDNGSGMEAEQIPLAFLRHATSKIEKVEDLEHIASLGFRGEALSSIAAVSQVELITKTPSSVSGSRYVIEGGQEHSLEELGAPEGTTFLVRNLFYNTPARSKFLKSDMTEANYIHTLMEQLALSHPEISFKYIQNKQVKLHTSGNYSVKDVIYSVYGREIARALLEVSQENSFMKIEGFVGKPEIARGNRSFENYYINGRYVKNNIITNPYGDYCPYNMTLYKESDFNLEVSLALKDKLTALGYKVSMTRETKNDLVNIYETMGSATMANDTSSKYNIAIHHNSTGAGGNQTSAKGIEVYIANDTKLSLATSIVDSLIKDANASPSYKYTNKVDEGIYQRLFTEKEILEDDVQPSNKTTDTPYYYNLREVGGISTHASNDGRYENIGPYYYPKNPYYNANKTAESYLIELGYLDNLEDLQNILNNKDGYANGIVNGFKNYLEKEAA